MTDVRVMVFNAYTAQMVAGSTVYLFEIFHGVGYSQTTDSSGVAYFYNLPSSRYSLSVARDGFRESNSEFAVGGDYMPVDVALQPTGGTPPPNPPVVTDLGFLVVDANNAPVQGAIVTLDNNTSQPTNSFGRTQFSQVGLWTHTFKVAKSGYNQSTGTVDASKVVDQKVTMTLISQPPPPPIVEHIVTIYVTNTSLVPLAGITVTLAKIDGGYANSKATAINGAAVFNRAPTGSYTVYVNNGSGTALNVVDDVTATYVLASPPPPPLGWTLTVQVLQEGGVMLPDRCAISAMQGNTTVQGKTSETNGSQVFTELPTGTYWVKVNFNTVDYNSEQFQITGNMSKTITLPRQGGPTISWEGNIPPFKDGSYKWSLRFNIVPIPFLDNYIVDWIAQRPQDEAALNTSLHSQGITGTATITNKEITKHQNAFGNVDQFTITYTFTLAGTGLNLTGQQSLVVWVPILVAAIPLILTLLTAVVYLMIVNSVVAGIKAIVGPDGDNVGILVAGGLGVAAIWYLGQGKKK